MDSVANLSAASYLTQASNTDGTRRTSELQSSGADFSLQAASTEAQEVEQAVSESAVNSVDQYSASSVELVTPTGQLSSDTQLGSLISTSV
jgi:hypothetical protein